MSVEQHFVPTYSFKTIEELNNYKNMREGVVFTVDHPSTNGKVFRFIRKKIVNDIIL